jgi:excisionase family DNA binding protein
MADDDWITAPTAARLLGLQLHTVYRLIENGDLGGVARMACA